MVRFKFWHMGTKKGSSRAALIVLATMLLGYILGNPVLIELAEKCDTVRFTGETFAGEALPAIVLAGTGSFRYLDG